MKKRKIIAICAPAPGRKLIYVASLTAKDDGNYHVTTSFNPDDAQDFHDAHEAQRIIPRLFNPWDREYGVVKIEVNATNRLLNPDLK